MFGKQVLNVNLLYSAPLHIKNTCVALDGAVIMTFKDMEISEFPPRVGSKTLKVDKGKHRLSVTDTNFKLKKEQSFEIKKKMWMDIIIHDDSISIHLLDKQPVYK